MKHISLEFLTPLVRDLLSYSVTEDYAEEIIGLDNFMERVREDIETSSAWTTEGHYNNSDVRMAVGRVILNVMKWELT